MENERFLVNMDERESHEPNVPQQIPFRGIEVICLCVLVQMSISTFSLLHLHLKSWVAIKCRNIDDNDLSLAEPLLQKVLKQLHNY